MDWALTVYSEGAARRRLREIGYLILLPFLTYLPLCAQSTHETDSLKQVLTQVQDTAKVRLLFQLSLAYHYSEPDTALQYAQASLSLAKSLRDDKGIGDGLITRGRLQRDQGNYGEALKDITASLTIYRTISDSVQIANALNDISIVYAMSGDDARALSYFEETLDLFRAINDTKGESHALNNIGVIHRSAGRLPTAKDYFLRSLRIKQARHDTLSIPRSYANLAGLFNELNQPEEALRYYRSADSLFRRINDKQGLASNLNAIANLYLQQSELLSAKKHATEGLEVAQAINALPMVEKTSQTLATISEQLQDYPAAYQYLQMHTATKDSLHNENQVRQLEELKARFDSEKQASEIAILKKDQQLREAHIQRQEMIKYGLLGGLLLLFLLLVIFFYAYRINCQQKKLLRVQNQEIQQQKEDLRELNQTKDRFFSIISHDIKGPLNTLKGFVFLLNQSAESLSQQEVQTMSNRIGESLNNLHQLLENLLTWSLSQIQQRTIHPESVSLYELTEDIFRLYEPTAAQKEVYLVNQASAGVLAWADNHSVHTILRNLIANSIKYSHPQTSVIVAVQATDEEVTVRVTDEGVGMDEETIQDLFALDKKTSEAGTANELGSGFGLVLCDELVRKNGGRLWVESEIHEGSTFIFTLPKKAHKPVRTDV